MLGGLNTWSAGGWRLGLQLDPNGIVYIKGTTMTFAGIAVAQAGNVLASRTSKASVFKTSLTGNKWIWMGIVAQISIIVSMVYVPLLQGLFGTAALDLSDWAFLALLAFIVILAEEIRKLFSRRLAK
jgi:magnesium-transporting ATPase (P-type)